MMTTKTAAAQQQLLLPVLSVLLLLLAAPVSAADERDWTPVANAVQAWIADGAFPGAVAVVGDRDGAVWRAAFGHLTYGRSPPPLTPDRNPAVSADDTVWDMASLTKVLATTTATMQFYQRGELALDEHVASERLLGAKFASAGKGAITVRHLLLHNAGFPPDPQPNYWDPAFGCPETTHRPHPRLRWSCQDRVFAAVLAQTLTQPPGEKYVYSDLSMITQMYVLGVLARDLGYVRAAELLPGCDGGGPGAAQCYYEAYVRRYVLEAAEMRRSGFLPPEELWPRAAPTWNDTVYQRRVMQGTVSDGNAYALGGVAGHAGLFSVVDDVAALLRRLMWAPDDATFANATTVELFTSVYNRTQSSRALGWDTNDYEMNTLRTCGNLSATTYLHTGFTGTQACNDREHGFFTVLLTNRVYPDEHNFKVEQARRDFNNAVLSVMTKAARPTTATTTTTEAA